MAQDLFRVLEIPLIVVMAIHLQVYGGFVMRIATCKCSVVMCLAASVCLSVCPCCLGS